MRRKHHLLWYPPGDGRAREYYVSPALFGFLLGAGVFLLVALVLGVLFYANLSERALERDQLLEENQHLRAEVGRVQRIESQLRELQRFSEQVKRSLTEGADLERILEAGEAVEEELPSGQEDKPWIPVDVSLDSLDDALEFMPKVQKGQELTLPDRWPVEGFLTRKYESAPIDPGLSHAGIDIAVPRGTPIRAVAAGTVVAADWTPRYGNRVILDHGASLMTLYGHNELLLVRPGDRIQAGTPIALSGNSGISTAPHLHFEVRVNGRAVDPLALLPKRGENNVVQ
ncbi:M23 family metallopeptidase [bacterium]|nr:M23 family metallopeptidase [bacterium]